MSSLYGPYEMGCTRVTMAKTTRSYGVIRSKSFKLSPSSDWRLQLVSMKLESLVIADQHAAVNMYLSLVHTARHIKRVERVQKSV